ncbi:HK97-gp10 family putative phage morphogenesis protein [Oceanobacter sp. 3_MG-2023]|uniref:HK97-gp10 family putative phage morphogenesis protein n=1 Tax=Oceanobacter sp. 3_MG-2023 TaxID=3062622 RepID=UPI002735C88A|nr:HK97-gp10 family putative phage morphogenesis protein [Oceanobacter sp. 3_MG-2023]MDP2505386.1 hypothetical protein [Oceanobacter sp. 3_MG-2023]
MANEQIEVTGLDELDAKFKEIDVITGQRILRGALMRASKPMQERMAETAPESTDPVYLGSNRKKKQKSSLKEGTKRWSEKANDEASATVNIGYRMKRHWYAGLLEFGTKRVAPMGWMRRAADDLWQQVATDFGTILAKRFKNLERKQAREAAKKAAGN